MLIVFMQVHLSGSTSSEREALLSQVKKDTGATFIPPYDYLGTILGQGTVALELEQQMKDFVSVESQQATLDAVIAPLGGGGLLGGIVRAISGPMVVRSVLTIPGHRPITS